MRTTEIFDTFLWFVDSTSRSNSYLGGAHFADLPVEATYRVFIRWASNYWCFQAVKFNLDIDRTLISKLRQSAEEEWVNKFIKYNMGINLSKLCIHRGFNNVTSVKDITCHSDILCSSTPEKFVNKKMKRIIVGEKCHWTGLSLCGKSRNWSKSYTEENS